MDSAGGFINEWPLSCRCQLPQMAHQLPRLVINMQILQKWYRARARENKRESDKREDAMDDDQFRIIVRSFAPVLLRLRCAGTLDGGSASLGKG